MLYVCIPPPQLTYECLNQSFLNLVCISWHLSPSQRHASQIPAPIVARQRLSRQVPAAKTTHVTIELLDTRSVSYQRRVSGSVCVSPYRC
jgi:hypothetical protein